MSGKSVCLLGGSGFVGRYLVSRLVRNGFSVRLLTRNRARHRDLEVLNGVAIVECNVHDPEQLKIHFSGQDVVINLVGILNEQGEQTFRKVHVELVKKIVAACQENQVSRLLQMSALSAHPRGSSQYLQSKGRAEKYLHEELKGEIAVTSFRPSVIFGIEDSFMNRFADLLKKIPFIFPLARAQARFAPVYVGDVADAFLRALSDDATVGKRIDLCGPKQYTLAELVAYCAQLVGVKRRIIPLPDTLARAQALVMEQLPGKPFSMDNYRSLLTDSICPKSTPTCPTPLEAVAPLYLGEEGFEARMQGYRRMHEE